MDRPHSIPLATWLTYTGAQQAHFAAQANAEAAALRREEAAEASDKAALGLLPAVIAEDQAAGRQPFGFAKCRLRDPSASVSFQRDADDGIYWIPRGRLEQVAWMVDIVEPAAEMRPAEQLALYLDRAIAEGRVPAAFAVVSHQASGTPGVEHYGPVRVLGEGVFLVPAAAVEPLRSHGFIPTNLPERRPS